MSTFHGNLVEEQPYKPAIILDYNQFMNGVDRNDQLTYYALNMKSVKWGKKVLWRMFELALVNVYQILKFKDATASQKRL